jgi:hypothetical protein
MAPYNIYTLIVDPLVYCFENFMQDYENMLPHVRKWASQAEKAVVKNIRTRADAKAFLESLYMPGTEYPTWYTELYTSITGERAGSPLRQKMERLKQEQPSVYQELVEHMRSYYYGHWIRTPYTEAMYRTQSFRRTKKSRINGPGKNPGGKSLFIELTSYLLDLTVILDFLLSEDKTFFVLTGIEHTSAIVNFFENKAAVFFKTSPDGNIPEGGAVQGIPDLENHIPEVLSRLVSLQ